MLAPRCNFIPTFAFAIYCVFPALLFFNALQIILICLAYNFPKFLKNKPWLLLWENLRNYFNNCYVLIVQDSLIDEEVKFCQPTENDTVDQSLFVITPL